MKPEAQRIAIAEACGWGKSEIAAWQDWDLTRQQHEWAQITTDEYYRRHLRVDPSPAPPPDYLNDLNAMNEAEKVIPAGREGEYRDNLTETAMRDCKGNWCAWWKATAAQRAEAFLKTIGKWEDGK